MTTSPRSRTTRTVHGAKLPPPAERPAVVPIYQTSTFAFDDAAAYAASLHQPGRGYVYTRYENPTTAELEATLADLEGGATAMAFASGMAAISSVLLTLCGAGDEVVASTALYGGTYSLLHDVAPRFGVVATLADPHPDAIAGAISERTRAVYVETIANPTMAVTDLPAVAAVARAAGVPLVVDNTVASPILCRPLEHGADVVVHSATKYLGGHHDVLLGAAVFADADLRQRVWRQAIDLGGSPDPFAAWLVLRGIRTLPLRMARHSATARVVAEHLAAHPAVARTWWPGLPSHPSHEVARRVLDDFSGFVAFEVAGGREGGQRFTERTQLIVLAPSLGGHETLITHPARTTPRQLDDAALDAAGIAPGLVRMSVGLEDAEDLLADLDQALEAAAAT